MTATWACDWTSSSAGRRGGGKGPQINAARTGSRCKKARMRQKLGTCRRHNNGLDRKRETYWEGLLQCDGDVLQTQTRNHTVVDAGQRGWLRVFTRQPCTTDDPLRTTREHPALAGQSRAVSPAPGYTIPGLHHSHLAVKRWATFDRLQPTGLPCLLPAMQLCRQSMAPGTSETSSELCVVQCSQYAGR